MLVSEKVIPKRPSSWVDHLFFWVGWDYIYIYLYIYINSDL